MMSRENLKEVGCIKFGSIRDCLGPNLRGSRGSIVFFLAIDELENRSPNRGIRMLPELMLFYLRAVQGRSVGNE